MFRWRRFDPLSVRLSDPLRALELQPYSLKPLLRRAMAYESLERYRKAYVDYKTVLQIDNGVQAAHDSIHRSAGNRQTYSQVFERYRRVRVTILIMCCQYLRCCTFFCCQTRTNLISVSSFSYKQVVQYLTGIRETLLEKHSSI